MKKDKMINFLIFFILIFLNNFCLSETKIPEEENNLLFNNSGVENYNKGDFTSARNNFIKGINNVSLYLDPITSSVLHNNLACVDLKENSINTNTEKNLYNSYLYLIEFNQSSYAFIVLNNIAIIEMRKGDYISASLKLEKVKKFNQIRMNKHAEAIADNNLSICYRKSGDFNKSIISVNNALDIFESEKYNLGLANAYYNKGMIYLEQNMSDIALDFFNIALTYDKKTNDKHNIEKTHQAIKKCKTILRNK